MSASREGSSTPVHRRVRRSDRRPRVRHLILGSLAVLTGLVAVAFVRPGSRWCWRSTAREASPDVLGTYTFLWRRERFEPASLFDPSASREATMTWQIYSLRLRARRSDQPHRPYGALRSRRRRRLRWNYQHSMGTHQYESVCCGRWVEGQVDDLPQRSDTDIARGLTADPIRENLGQRTSDQQLHRPHA